MNPLGRSELADQLRALGVANGGVLLVHTSFRAIRPVEGGPLGLIHALRDAIGPDGTLVMPSCPAMTAVPSIRRPHPRRGGRFAAHRAGGERSPRRFRDRGRPKHCTVLKNGHPARIEYGENDHCCARFELADEWLRERGLLSDGRVGHGRARLARSRDIVAVAVPRLKENPLLFLHPAGEGCGECDAARRSVP